MTNSISFEELEDAVSIDRYDLDTELIRQPELFSNVALGLVDAQSERDFLKSERESLMAKISRRIRQAWEEQGVSFTVDKVKAAVLEDDEYLDVQEAYLKSCEEADKWAALRDVYRQRADMLRSLVSLHGMEYYSSPSATGNRKAVQMSTRAKWRGQKARRQRETDDG